MTHEVNFDADALVSKCAGCGNAVPFDYTVTEGFWKQHVPEDCRSRVLCLPCLDTIAGGIPPEALLAVYYSGAAGTIPLVRVRR